MIFDLDDQDITDLLAALSEAVTRYINYPDFVGDEMRARKDRWEALADMLDAHLDPKTMALVHPVGEGADAHWREFMCPHCKKRSALVDVDASVCGHEVGEVTLNPYARDQGRKPYVGMVSYKHADWHTSHYACSECGGVVAPPADMEIHS
jgi:hypothetical protein